MQLTQQERQLIQISFAKLDRPGGDFARYFFDLLFEVAPLVKPMFVTERNLLEQHFYELFSTAIKKMDSFDSIKPTLRALGRQHARHQVKKEQFSVVKSVLLLAIDYMEAGTCSSETLNAWGHYFDCIAAAMQQGMDEVTELSAPVYNMGPGSLADPASLNEQASPIEQAELNQQAALFDPAEQNEHAAQGHWGAQTVTHSPTQ
ncbi:hypothetical protein KJI95_05355 [Shewanella sp. JM162201]|uniref:Globin domain-containing protein n=1 Tax=Shewanella jiangmenensis TaxID=2837387 RepID=A0ABS5V2C7_9GAMM|nr:globin domain-containing protein [Shewanella jiangmenensis]MBT1443951.1 hypothetical protein [Shewanella jiangmenensis]